ncbi:cytochrome c family protein [Deferribacter desulfuricans SSM1]|uniref:Cytochrome c family protein n=1 Tax=Deferribacter desulfuricans (strain DSM 14783 / JCM 11476 / NBRC 101012 / SSM1) TaxID=639282 RepID=D3PAF2_DEFDS|nr:hypothetical protein [Deferribacter desulfuricans]BAI79575.1 cytochrome c family protein [Deferribacter desulfuricans SSM1]
MKKKTVIFLTTLILILSLAINAFAVSQRAGKRKFKKYCHKTCHSGKKKDITYVTPSTFTIEQWKYYFQNKRKRLIAIHKNGELDTIKLKEKDWKNIEAFLTNHGLGSFEPESCTQ